MPETCHACHPASPDSTGLCDRHAAIIAAAARRARAQAKPGPKPKSTNHEPAYRVVKQRYFQPGSHA